MPTFLATVAAAILAELGSSAAAPAAARIRAALAQSARIGGPRLAARAAPQLAPPRAELTPPVSFGPPVPGARPGSASSIAAKLAARR